MKINPISECRCDERLKTKSEESTRLTYTGFHGEIEHLKIKTQKQVTLDLAHVEDLRVKLNLDGVTITSKSHTHPSH